MYFKGILAIGIPVRFPFCSVAFVRTMISVCVGAVVPRDLQRVIDIVAEKIVGHTRLGASMCVYVCVNVNACTMRCRRPLDVCILCIMYSHSLVFIVSSESFELCDFAFSSSSLP